MQPDVYKRMTDRFLISYLAEETVLMDKQTGDHFGINKVGTAIWEMLATPCTADAIVGQLLNRFEVDAATCASEVRQFLKTLKEKEMLLNRL